MLERATEDQHLPHTPRLPFPGTPPRFAWDASHFAAGQRPAAPRQDTAGGTA